MVAIISQTKLRSSRRRRKKFGTNTRYSKTLGIIFVSLLRHIVDNVTQSGKKPECRERKWRSRTLRRSNK